MGVAARRVEYLPLAELKSAHRNPKLHAQDDIQASLARRGMVEPPTLDERTGRLVAGHGRVEALRALAAGGGAPPEGVERRGDGWWVPVLRGWASKDDVDAEAYLVASNQLTIAGGWDEGLRDILKDLAGKDALEGLGFGPAELEALLAPQAESQEGLADPDAVPALPAKSWVEPGDLFELGRHRLLCGDCTSEVAMERLLGDAKADICWTDPPWNVAYGDDDHQAHKKHEAIANDNLGDAFPGFVSAFCGSIKKALKPGAAIYLAMSAQEWPVIDAALRALNFHWSSTIIWTKDSLVLSRKDYHTQYEPIWYGWNGDAARLCPLKDRKQSDVWPIPRPKRSDEHPTMKPVELVGRSIRNSSHRGALVLEPFSGSGSTLIACEALGRACCAIELEPRYVQVALERWATFTGRKWKKL
jgi:DNA modification methylase